MLNLKKVNFAVIVIIQGATIAITQSAFTTKTLAPNYGKLIDGGIVKWISLASLNMTYPGDMLGAHQYTCDFSLNVCAGYFPSQPADNTPDPTVVSLGEFRYQP